MKHKHIEELAREFIVGRARRPANPRVQEILLRFTADILKIIEDLDLSDDEVWTALDLLEEAGRNNEIKLMAVGLGVDRFLDIRQEEAEARFGIGGGTPRSIEGPLYVHGAPVRRGLVRLDDDPDDQARVFFMQGQVTDVNNSPLPGAVVEVWHANSRGNYSHFDKSQSPYNLRRTIITDERGRFQFRSLLPAGYGVPPDGATQKMLDELGRHGQRPPHLHFFVHTEGHRKLTTQLNLPGSPYTYDDYAFSDRPSLVPEMVLIEEPDELAKRQLDQPFFLIDYNFRLHPDVPGAPSSDVERSRARDGLDPRKGSQEADTYYLHRLPVAEDGQLEMISSPMKTEALPLEEEA